MKDLRDYLIIISNLMLIKSNSNTVPYTQKKVSDWHLTFYLIMYI